MSIKIVSEALPNETPVLHLTGRLAQQEAAAALREALAELLDGPAGDAVILDFSGVEYIDSTGLGLLVSSFIKAQNAGKRLVLAGISGKLRDILEITKLRSVFDVYDSVESARDAVAGA